MWWWKVAPRRLAHGVLRTSFDTSENPPEAGPRQVAPAIWTIDASGIPDEAPARVEERYAKWVPAGDRRWVEVLSRAGAQDGDL